MKGISYLVGRDAYFFPLLVTRLSSFVSRKKGALIRAVYHCEVVAVSIFVSIGTCSLFGRDAYLVFRKSGEVFKGVPASIPS